MTPLPSATDMDGTEVLVGDLVSTHYHGRVVVREIVRMEIMAEARQVVLRYLDQAGRPSWDHACFVRKAEPTITLTGFGDFKYEKGSTSCLPVTRVNSSASTAASKSTTLRPRAQRTTTRKKRGA